MQDYREIRKNQKLIKKHQDAYSLGRYSEAINRYPINSEKSKVFDFGRLAKLMKEKRT